MKKVIFLDPPHYYWPMISNYFDSFVMPLSYLSLTGMLLENEAARPIILDCSFLRMGWKSLERRLRKERPDILCIGTKTTFAPEAMRAFSLAKEINPGIINIGGGYFYSALPGESLRDSPIDIIVRWEGEETLLELIRELERPEPCLHDVKGICFQENGQTIETPIRDLVEDLDSLPFPAYLNLPNHQDYAPPGKWPGTIVLQHSRGCPATCTFCSCWDQEGEHCVEDGRLRARPRYRTKSPERMAEEIEAYQRRYHKKHFVFIDATWNVDPKWNEAFCELVLQRGLKFSWYAFLRGDFLLRDEERGVLSKMVDAGLSHAFVGLERPDDNELQAVQKGISTDTAYRVANLLRSKYPQVVSQGSMLVGMPEESPDSIDRVIDHSLQLPMDFTSIYILMPHPGTEIWKEAVKEDRIRAKDYSEYDWLFPVMDSIHMSRKEIYQAVLEYPRRMMRRPFRVLKGLVSRSSFKRSAYRHFVFNALKVLWLSKIVRGRNKPWSMRKPSWYDK